jgi:hypothetical protein
MPKRPMVALATWLETSLGLLFAEMTFVLFPYN